MSSNDNRKIILKAIIEIFIGGITFIVFGIIAVLLEDYTFSVFFFGFSLASISSFYSYQSQYKKYKKTFYEKLNREISSLEINSKDVIW